VTATSTQAGQSNNGCISAHVDSTSPWPLHPEMDSSGYFMELNRTFQGKNTQQLCRVSNQYSDDWYNRTRLRRTYILPEVGGDFRR